MKQTFGQKKENECPAKKLKLNFIGDAELLKSISLGETYNIG